MELGNCVVIGGTGFIGSHFARYVLGENLVQHLWLVDIQEPRTSKGAHMLQAELQRGRVSYLRADVRSAMGDLGLPSRPDLIVNLAAICRDSGYEAPEYFATNVAGAENVCSWADQVGCRCLIFVSSTYTYGPTDEPKSESSPPEPVTAYGSSKVLAEKIHLAWQAQRPERKLVIVRPGVIFGEGENGNITRLMRAVQGRYFFYPGNRRVLKAGGYVKDLCHALMWVLDRLETRNENLAIFNFTLDPAPSVEDYVRALCKAEGIERWVPSVPYPLLLAGSYLLEGFARALSIEQPIKPARVRKLVQSTNIVPEYLRQAGYSHRYSLAEAFADWKLDRLELSKCQAEATKGMGAVESQEAAVDQRRIGAHFRPTAGENRR